MKPQLYSGNTFEADGVTFRVTFDQDDCGEYPWDWCDGHGVVRKSHAQHREGYSDKKPGERPMNKSGRNEYQFYYDVAASMKLAKQDGWNTAPYDVPNKAQRAIDADFKYLSGFINGDWCYITVHVELLDADGAVLSDDYLGMVESIGDHASDCAYDMANTLLHDYKVSNRFNDAMTLGV